MEDLRTEKNSIFGVINNDNTIKKLGNFLVKYYKKIIAIIVLCTIFTAPYMIGHFLFWWVTSFISGIMGM